MSHSLQTKTECGVPSLNDFSIVQSKFVAHQVKKQNELLKKLNIKAV